MWDSRADSVHYTQRDWSVRENLQPGSRNVKSQPLVNTDDILLPPLHIKLGLMKNFVKALDKEGKAFSHLHQRFLMSNTSFDLCMKDIESRAWLALKSIIKKFLGNHRSTEYINIVDELLLCFKISVQVCL